MIKKIKMVDFELHCISKEDGECMFILQEVLLKINMKNTSQVSKKTGIPSEIVTYNLKENKQLRQDLIKYYTISLKTPKITLITEAGLYKLLIMGKSAESKKFLDWITCEVIPQATEGKFNVNKQDHEWYPF